MHVALTAGKTWEEIAAALGYDGKQPATQAKARYTSLQRRFPGWKKPGDTTAPPAP